MAATIRASTAPSAVLNPTSPASTAVGDLVVVITASVAGAGVPTHNLQAGFTSIIDHAHDDGSTDGRVSVACKVATSAGAVAYQAYTATGATTSHSGIIVLTVGTFESSLTNITSWLAASITGTTNAAPDPPAITPTRSGSLVVLIGFWHYGTTSTTTTVTQPANYSSVTEYAGAATCELAVSQRTSAPTVNVSENPATYVDNTVPNGTVAITIAFYPRAISFAADSYTLTRTSPAVGLTKQSKVVADQGSLTLAANAVIPKVAMPAASQSLGLTGNATGLRAARTLALAAHALALAGNTMTPKVSMPAAVVSFSETGNAVALVYTPFTGYTFLADSGALALSGPATGLRAQRRVGVSVGSLALSGNDGGVLREAKVVASQGAIALSGPATAFSVGMPVAVASFAETGVVASLRAARYLSVDTGAFARLDNAAGLMAQRRVAASTGSLATTGTVSGLRQTRVLAGDVGALALAGIDAQLRAVRGVVVVAASFATIGSAVSLPSGKGMQAGSGVYATTAATASFVVQRRFVVALGTMSLAGGAAPLVRGLELAAATGTFVSAGASADFLYERGIAADAGVFGLDGSVSFVVSRLLPSAMRWAVRDAQARQIISVAIVRDVSIVAQAREDDS